MSDLADRNANILALYREDIPRKEIAERCGVTLDVVKTVIKIGRKIEGAGALVVVDPPRGALAAYEHMLSAIAACIVASDAKEIADQAEAMRVYARQANNRDAEIDAAEIRIRAERRLGEIIIEQKATIGLHAGGRPSLEAAPETGSSEAPVLPRVTLAEAGIDKKLSARAQKLGKMEADDFAWQLSGWREKAMEEGSRVSVRLLKGEAQQTKAQARDIKVEILGRRIRALPDEKFGIIVADPEWRFEPRSRLTGMDRAADNHYPTSTLEALMARPVAGIAASDCILFLWATVPMLAEAFCVLDAWGFASFVRDPESGFLMPDKTTARYVSSAAWWKHSEGGIGTGYWFRVDHELLLVATRGHPIAPLMGTQERSLFDIPASHVHSQKPDLPLEMIDRMWPTLPKIELNRIGPARAGWSAWGNEVEVGTSPESPEDRASESGEPAENTDLGTGDILEIAAGVLAPEGYPVDGHGGDESPSPPPPAQKDAGPIPVFLLRDKPERSEAA